MTGYRLLPAVLVAILCAAPAYAQLSPKDRETTLFRTQATPAPPPKPANAATASDVKVGMALRGSKGQELGQIVSLNKNVTGQLVTLVVKGPDGVNRVVPVVDMVVKDGAAVTTLNWYDVQALPRS